MEKKMLLAFPQLSTLRQIINGSYSDCVLGATKKII